MDREAIAHARPALARPPVTGLATRDADRGFLTVETAVQRYGVSRRTLYRLAAAGRLRRFRRPGDPRTYLQVAELNDELRLRPVAEKPEVEAGHN